MTTFGWKRKLGSRISREASATFEHESKNEDIDDDSVDWLTLQPKRAHFVCLEDNKAKSNRLKQEGSLLAESERFIVLILTCN